MPYTPQTPIELPIRSAASPPQLTYPDVFATEETVGYAQVRAELVWSKTFSGDGLRSRLDDERELRYRAAMRSAVK